MVREVLSVTRPAWAMLAWGTALLLPACAPAAPRVAGPATQSAAAGPCNAAPAQAALGQAASPQLAEWARLQAGARIVRVIGHDDMVTRDYDTGRLNLQLDEARRVVRVFCG